MAVVVDANLLIVLVTDDPRGPMSDRLLRRWIAGGDELHAPALLPYEVASGLTRAIAAGRLAAARIEDAWATILDLPIGYHPLSDAGPRVIGIARQLGRQSAYDAAYVALAEDLHATVWTLDARLARNASGHGLPVQLAE